MAEDEMTLAEVAQAARIEYGVAWRAAVRGDLKATRGAWGWKVSGPAGRAYVRAVEFAREGQRLAAEYRARAADQEEPAPAELDATGLMTRVIAASDERRSA